MPYFTITETRHVRVRFSVEAENEDEAELLFLTSSERLRLIDEDILDSEGLEITEDND